METRTNKEENIARIQRFGEMLNYASAIFQDPVVANAFKKNILSAVFACTDRHPDELHKIIAVWYGVEEDALVIDMAELLNKLIEELNKPSVQTFFTLLAQSGAAASSGSATENTVANGS